jgi:hypothetical protein
VLRNPTGTGNTYGVPIESVQLTEAGPGQVSTLAFVIEDPDLQISVLPGSYVRFMDIARDVPIFAGYVDTVRYGMMGLGQTLAVMAVGVEILLDWAYTPGLTIPSGTTIGTGVQMIVASCVGSLPVNTRKSASPPTAAIPMQDTGETLGANVVIPAGTLRAALDAYAPAVVIALADWFSTFEYTVYATVDFRHGLRWFWTIGGYTWGDTVSPNAVTISTAGPIYPADVDLSLANPDRPRVVVVNGSGAGSIVMADGSGLPGQTTVIADSNSTTYNYAVSVARASIGRAGQVWTGSVTVDDALNIGAPGAEYHAGIRVALTAPGYAFSGATFRAWTIDKSFTSDDKEQWVLRLGGRQLASRYLRRMTPSSNTV